MKLTYILLLFGVMCFSCTKNKVKFKVNEAQKTQNQKSQSLSYEQFKSKLITDKKTFINKTDLQKSEFFYQLIDEDIYSYWRGTLWDFNGTSQKPGAGTIACGYFITNTLADLGLNIQRIKLAQAPSSKMIKELCVNVANFSKFSQLEEYLSSQPDDSVFIVGLDFHTGYLIKDKSGIYFLHSNYINKAGVMKETAARSTALLSSKSYMVGNLTSNKKLMNQWIANN